MSFNVACPHCKRVLNVTEKAFGKTLPCPGCKQPMTVPNGPEPHPSAATVGGRSTPAAPQTPQLPPGMPPVPEVASPSSAFGDGAQRAAISSPGTRVGPSLPGGATEDTYEPVAKANRSFVLVWIVFFLAFQGVMLIIFGLVMAFVAGAAGGMAGAAGQFGPQHELGGFLVAHSGVIIEGVALALVHTGLLTLVTCHGLWAFRIWGLWLARVLAIVYIVLLLFVVGSTPASADRNSVQVGTVTSIVGLGLWAATLGYLFASSEIPNRADQQSRFRSRLRIGSD